MASLKDASSEAANNQYRYPRLFNLEMFAFTVAALSALAMLWTVLSPNVSVVVMIVAGMVFTLSIVVVIRLLMDPDSVRAHQSDDMLQLASQFLDLMKDGMTPDAAQRICTLLLPSTAAVAVAITDTEQILGYAGFQEAENPAGSTIRTQATLDAMEDGTMHVLYTADDLGFPRSATIKAAIIVPLRVGDKVEGSLKFYYRSGKKITETQKSIAQGFGRLLSTQMAAVEMEAQRKLATSMELKMLQSQINPHFLFNTINTIASLIRTDPPKARTMLREFAVFYRRTLEDSTDRIMLSREIEQTMRYFSFEVARFGEDRVALYVGAGPELQDMLVPPFIIQPIVENAVKHAMPQEGKLTVSILAQVDGDDVVVEVRDDGVGMSEQACQNIMHPESQTGLGIAVKNVHDRMKGFFGPDACMEVESELGKGTRVMLRFPGCAKNHAAMLGGEAVTAAVADAAGAVAAAVADVAPVMVGAPAIASAAVSGKAPAPAASGVGAAAASGSERDGATIAPAMPSVDRPTAAGIPAAGAGKGAAEGDEGARRVGMIGRRGPGDGAVIDIASAVVAPAEEAPLPVGRIRVVEGRVARSRRAAEEAGGAQAPEGAAATIMRGMQGIEDVEAQVAARVAENRRRRALDIDDPDAEAAGA